jgi:hypothetical protein
MKKLLVIVMASLLGSISLTFPANGATFAEYKKCTTPGQSKNGLACVQGIDGKLIWVTMSSIVVEPGQPVYRSCKKAGERKILKYWSGDPGVVYQDQFGCLTLTSEMIKDIKLENDMGCTITNWLNNLNQEREKATNCAFGNWKSGQKVWWLVPGGFPYTNIVPFEKVQASPAEMFVTKDTPEIPSCYLGQSCGPNQMKRYAEVISSYPNAIVHPAKNNVQTGSNPTQSSSSGQSSTTSCSTISGALVSVNIEYGSLTFTNPFACKITLQISGQINCKATWVPMPVSASISMNSKESKNIAIGGVFPSALASCKSFMALNGLAYDGSGGLTACMNKTCMSAFRFTGRIA